MSVVEKLVLLFFIGTQVACSEEDRNDVATRDRPNFIVVFVDDQGYQDLGCYGSPLIKTPHIDRMAIEGIRFTDFYVQPVCGPSRSALMTGCYPLRIAQKHNRTEIHPYVHLQEITIAEVLKTRGYKTGMFGKWDNAGHNQLKFDPTLMPNKQGFDYFFGTPSSNDGFVNLYRNEKLIEEKADMKLLTQRYTDEAIAFIKKNKKHPFFVYVPHTMPHTKLAASAKFEGKSKRGLYGDVIEEIDYNVGRLLKTIEDLGLDDATYVIYLSDNGPWHIKKSHGGSALPLRGAKTSAWEGGMRVPFVIRAPGRVVKGAVCRRIAASIDILPTLAHLAGAKLPNDRVIDGLNMSELFKNPEGDGPRDHYFYYQHTYLRAVRLGDWKLHLAHPAGGDQIFKRWKGHGKVEDAVLFKKPALYNLEGDISESTDVASQHPEVVKRLMALAEKARKDIGDYNVIGEGARFFDKQPRRADISQ